MKRLLFVIVAAAGVQGCTALSLERHTVNQALSITELRYREVLHGLALVAQNRAELPAFSVIASGITTVTNTGQVEPATLWDIIKFKGFSMQTLSLMGRYQPEQQWNLSPVVSYPQLKGMWYACLWVIEGAAPPGSEAWELLRGPTFGEIEGYHLDVLDKLVQLPQGWLRVGKAKDVPGNACYTAHCGDTYVWVTPAGLEGLSAFTLVILDIATTDPQSLQLPIPMATVESKISVPVTSPKMPYVDRAELPFPRKVGAAECPNPPHFDITLTETVRAMQSLVHCPDGCVRPGDIEVARPLLQTPCVKFGDVPSAAPNPQPRYTSPSQANQTQANMALFRSIINAGR